MIILESKLAKKYAVAFLNVYGETCLPQHRSSIITFTKFVAGHKIFQMVLSLPSLTFEKKREVIKVVMNKLDLPGCIEKLILLLLKHKRIDLIASVLEKILQLNKARAKEHHFSITTSHTLEKKEQDAMVEFIKHSIDRKVVASFDLDPSLISGIRIKGSGYLLERSIAKQLETIDQKILRREELW